MGRYGTLALLACTATVLVGLVTRVAAQPAAAESGRLKTQVVTYGPTSWVYTLDTASGRVWFLDKHADGTWQWVDDGAAPDGPGPVGRYDLAPFANDKGAHVYVCDTTTSRLWLLDEKNLQWLPRGAPVPGDSRTGDAGQATPPGRFRAQVVTGAQAFWVYTLDTTTGRLWFLDKQADGEWQWADEGASPNGPGVIGRYQLAAFANEQGSHVHVADTTTGAVWLVDEDNHKWLPRGAPTR